MTQRRWTVPYCAALLCSLTSHAAPCLAQQARPRTAEAPPATAPRAATTAPAQKTAPSPIDPRRMNEVLDRWAAKARQTTSLSARFDRLDVDGVWKEETRYQGMARLKSPDKVYLNFDKVLKSGNKPEPNERIVCSGTDIYQFLPDTKQVHYYPLPPEERKRMTEEGPLPFLFHFDAAKARAEYDMSIRMEDEKHYVIQIKPLKPANRDSFAAAYVWLDKVELRPAQIRLFDAANPKNYKTYRFTEVQVNVSVPDSWFNGRAQWDQLRKADPNWKVVMHDAQGQALDAQGRPIAQAAAASAPAPGGGAPGAPRTVIAPRR